MTLSNILLLQSENAGEGMESKVSFPEEVYKDLVPILYDFFVCVWEVAWLQGGHLSQVKVVQEDKLLKILK